ncbi:MAG: hypothetical protein P1V36_04360, partial [Planctomycetota bacterium]|nr:hypothetical protein [Planctomycetota bacterium]
MAARVYACLVALVAVIALAAPARGDVDLDAEVERLVGADATQRSAAYNALQRAKDPAIVARLVKRLPAAEDMAQYY